jgi:chemotaxis protein methyltransferase CheR
MTLIEEMITIEDTALQLFLEAIYAKYGYDFRDYNLTSVKRQLQHRLGVSGFKNLFELQQKALDDPEFFKRLLNDLSITFSEMFRDPSFYRALRTHVFPVLRTYPTIKIWHAGCAGGEEVYSLAILLQEEGLYDRTQIYATDLNQTILEKAKKGTYLFDHLSKYTVNYQESGGKESFARYITTSYNVMIMDEALKAHIVFAIHDLVQDGVLDEMHLILCRNVLVYFNGNLQCHVLKLFFDSLVPEGLLCMGSHEHIRFSYYSRYFDSLIREEQIYKRKLRAWGL